MRTSKFLLLFAMVFTMFACNDEYPELEDGMYAEFKTNYGTFVAELFYEETPITVSSFVSLAEGTNKMVDSTYKGKNYYNGLTFHRIIDGFVIQGGDPTGTGSGGPGYKFPDEIVDSLSHDSKGILSMANAGPGTNGSQFFVTLAPTQNLDGRHTVFGKIVKGQDVVDSIGKVETGPQDKPIKTVTMEEVNIIRKGKDAKNFEAPKVFEDELQAIKEKEDAEAKKRQEAKEEMAKTFESHKDEAKALDSGLQIYFEEKGEGEKPETGQMVMVSYEGYFEDGDIFDTSKKELAKEMGLFNPNREAQGGYGPMAIVYGPDAPMIPGFKEGVQQMSVGDQALLYIPSHLGYGERGAGGVIPPNTNLVFRVKLESIKE
ncbi:peptidylprolyl isomerase [Salegentibacter maritimus]|uniref:peptidylprolyl isomerase n=1 Tax=Salegentibacter maritimus TaxID=2794347 RepID=UPI0018E40A56|nr:peptidylprolyl isomerase [Salegentibacter maritimus]MBI6116510.1 peptidylprolyl isomerase [Salegentibacter maritimus]